MYKECHIVNIHNRYLKMKMLRDKESNMKNKEESCNKE